MLEFLRGKVSERKLRLFACACCRRFWNFLLDGRSRKALELSERYADGGAARPELSRVYWAARRAADVLGHAPARAAAWAAFTDLDPADTSQLAALTAVPSGLLPSEARARPEYREERVLQSGLLRCVVNSPFHPVLLDTAWQTTNAVVLARTMYDTRDFTLMPLLADLLEEAGCPAEVSDHCRGPGPHVRGCWVVDLLLNRT